MWRRAAAAVCAALLAPGVGLAQAPTPPAKPVEVLKPQVPIGSELVVEDLRKGSGVEARPGTLITVHYTGWLYDPRQPGGKGRKFDSSRDRRRAFAFGLGEGKVIKGWELGMQGMQVGGSRRLIIPPGLAYGPRNVGNGLIPPNSTLLFEVELLGVERSTTTLNAR